MREETKFALKKVQVEVETDMFDILENLSIEEKKEVLEYSQSFSDGICKIVEFFIHSDEIDDKIKDLKKYILNRPISLDEYKSLGAREE